MVAIRTQKGKANFIRISIPSSGEEKEVCICKENIDISTRGCTSNINGRLLSEVMANQGTYAPGNLKRYRAEGMVDQGCTYCYAGWKNKGNVYPKTIDRKTEEQFRAMRPLNPMGMSGIQEKIIRLGKNTSSTHPIYVPVFMDILELGRKYNILFIIPSKDLAFGTEGIRQAGLEELFPNIPSGRDIAAKFRDRAVVNMSIGYNKLEPGLVSQGFSNEWRIWQAEQYKQAGVNVTLTIVCDVTSSIEENTQRGSAVKLAMGAWKKGVPIRILPLRPKNEDVVQLALGKSRLEATYDKNRLKEIRKELRELEHQGMMFSREDDRVARASQLLAEAEEILKRPYVLRSNRELDPRFWHQDFEHLVKENNLGVCGRVGEDEYCDHCHLFGDRVRIKFPKSWIIPVEYKTSRRWKKLPLFGRKTKQ